MRVNRSRQRQKRKPSQRETRCLYPSIDLRCVRNVRSRTPLMLAITVELSRQRSYHVNHAISKGTALGSGVRSIGYGGTPGGTRTPDARLRTPPLCPTELQGQKPSGGDSGARTRNLGIANAALSQLSYIPTVPAITPSPMRKPQIYRSQQGPLVSRNAGLNSFQQTDVGDPRRLRPFGVDKVYAFACYNRQTWLVEYGLQGLGRV